MRLGERRLRHVTVSPSFAPLRGRSRGAGAMANAMLEVFPDALAPLKEADPEVWTLVQKEKERQWCAWLTAPRA